MNNGKSNFNKHQMAGFTFSEFLIVAGVVAALFAVAVPTVQTYQSRTFYLDVINTTAPYKVAIASCIQLTGSISNCDAGDNGVPHSITSPQGQVNTLVVSNGVISVTPVASNGIEASGHLYINTRC